MLCQCDNKYSASTSGIKGVPPFKVIRSPRLIIFSFDDFSDFGMA
jgi:hypothetical protein